MSHTCNFLSAYVEEEPDIGGIVETSDLPDSREQKSIREVEG